MNLINCFQQHNFDNFENIFTVRRKVFEIWSSGYEPNDFYIERRFDFNTLKIYVTTKPNVKKKYILLGTKHHYFPIYGHFYNNANHFIYKKIFNKKIQDVFEPVKYHIIPYYELAKPAPRHYYKCSSMDNLYEIIKKLKAREIPDIFDSSVLIKDVDEFNEIYAYNNLYTYENGDEQITEYLSDDQIKFTYDNETHILHIE